MKSKAYLYSLVVSTLLHVSILWTPSFLQSPNKAEHSSIIVKYQSQSQHKPFINKQSISGKKSHNQITNKATNVLKSASAEDLLSDPNVGILFSEYFQKVRQKIVEEVQKLRTSQIQGVTQLQFELSEDGVVVSINPLWSSIRPSDSLDEIKRVIVSSGPFDAFPEEISYKSISFKIKFRFT